jgi:hypothetical protein
LSLTFGLQLGCKMKTSQSLQESYKIAQFGMSEMS